MKPGLTLLAMSCALALAACGGDDRADETSATATTDPVNAAPANSGALDSAMGPAPTGVDDPMDATAMDPATPIDPTMDGDAGTVADATDATGNTDAAGDQAAASAGSCEVNLEGNDRMQFNLDTINVPASCSEFTINLQHTGQLPEAAMGHNVVVVESDDFAGVAADGLTAGADAEYVPQDDDRVIAFTEIIGGGESTSVTFSTSSLEEGGDYTFFCSFPGHSALMRGSLNFGG